MQIDKEHDAIRPGRLSADRWQRNWRTGSSFSSLGLSFDSCWLIQGCLKKRGIVSLKDLSPIPQAPSSALRVGGRSPRGVGSNRYDVHPFPFSGCSHL